MRPLHVLAVVASIVAAASGQTRPATRPAVTVAVLDFDAAVPGNADLGKQAGDAVTALLGTSAGVTLVDRTQISRTLGEAELSLSGLVESDKAVRIGKLVGAKVLVTGRIFTLDKSVYATAKLIGTETTRVEGVLIKATAPADTGELVAQLAEKVRQKLDGGVANLLPDDAPPPDPLAALRVRLAGKQKPVVMIQVSERLIARAEPANDPPADTQLRAMFLACGFTVVDPAETTAAKAGVGLLVKGEAFGEFAARVGNLFSCTGRAELSLVRFSDGVIVATTQAVARSADLSENIAGKSAVQKAADQGGMELLAKLADTLPDAKEKP